MHHIFLIKSPLQLLNAVEAKHHFCLNDSDCYLVIMSDRKSNPQLLNLVKITDKWKSIVLINKIGMYSTDPWMRNIDSVDTVSFNTSRLQGSVFQVSRINRLVSGISDVGYVFMGDYNNKFMRHFVNRMAHRETILLDDGTATLDVARMRYSGEKDRKPNTLYKRIKLRAKRMFQGLDDNKPETVLFFTTYNIDVSGCDKIERNHFSYLRNLSASLSITDAVHFLGSPLSEVGLMTEADYLDQLRMVRSRFPGREFVYVTHRREAPAKLEKISNMADIRVVSFEYPVEYQFALIGPRPATVASFITSALDTLSVIFGNTMSIIAYKLIKGSYREAERIEAIYSHYLTHATDNFQVVELVRQDSLS